MKRIVLPVLLAAIIGLPAGCGGDGDGSDGAMADPAAFCDGWAGLPELASEDLETVTEGVQQLVESAPEQIRDDVETFQQVFEDAGDDPGAITAEDEAARDRIEAWVGDNC